MNIDFLPLLLSFAILIFLLFLKKQPLPHVYYSDLTPFAGLRRKYTHLPHWITMFGISALLFAFIDPRIETPLATERSEGIAIYLVLDNSGSMGAQIVDTKKGEVVGFVTKLNLLKRVTEQFIEGNQDLLGLIAFARLPQVLSPLTAHHQVLLEKLKTLKIIDDPSQNGTAIGYAIYKTANIVAATRELSKDVYAINSAAIVLVTDGFQNPHRDDLGNSTRSIGIEQAAEFAKEQNIHLYLVSIDPLINSEEYSPQRNLMKRASEATGGAFYSVDDPDQMLEVYQSINTLEKSELIETRGTLVAYHLKSFLIGIASVLFLGSYLLDRRRMP